MQDIPKYLLVDTKVLPEVFSKVMLAKRLLARGKAKNSSEAAKMAGISRSAYYKYKDSVHAPQTAVSDNITTYYAVLEDIPGVLSSFITELYKAGANILTVNQNIPVDGVAPVSISARTNHLQMDEDEFVSYLTGLSGVVEVKKLTSQ